MVPSSSPLRFLLLSVVGALSCAAVSVPFEPPAQALVPADAGAIAAKVWGPDAFLPVTAERIAKLEASEQAAWRAYVAESERRTQLLAKRDLVDHSSNKPLPGGPIGSSHSRGVRLDAKPGYYASEAARVTADRVVSWQTAVGGWTKSGDYTRERQPADDHHDAWSAGTFDNDATITELRFLALVAQAAPDSPRRAAWLQAFERGLSYVFAAQYPNGGYPQIYPLVGWYHDAITFNDDAMVHILELLRDLSARQNEFAFLSVADAKTAAEQLQRGIRCVLAAQLQSPSGRLSIWPQQCDPLTLAPCAARNFEPISSCSSESAGLTEFLMSIPQPSSEVRQAIEAAMAWFQTTALHGVVWQRPAKTGNGLVERAGAPDLWARFYDLETGRPVFGDRDRTMHFAVTELSDERRLGYGWFNSRGASLASRFSEWRKRNAAR